MAAFIALATIAGWATYQSRTTPAWTPETIVGLVLDLLPVVCPVLLPAALLLRHPDAPRVARPLFFGTLMIAAAPFLQLAEPGLEAWFATLTPPPEDLEWFVPSGIVFGYVSSLIGMIGVLSVALGLSKARHWAYRSNARAAGFAILGIGLVTALATIVSFTQTDLTEIEMTGALWAYLIASVVVSVITILTWSYLAMTLVRCALSGEEPGLGWLTAALGTCLIVATFAIGAWANIVQTSNEALNNVIFWVSNGTYSLGYLALFLGFVLGMPSLEPEEPPA